MDTASSGWTKAHDEGRIHLERVFGEKVKVLTYDHADSHEQTEEILDLAVEDGAQVVFTTSPQLGRATLKAALKYPKVRFLNCSINLPFPSIRSYYSRIHEGKFITGAIAGAMTKNDRIGYVAAYPIYGEPASINAFALGAQLTNPRAKVELRWTCRPGSPVQDLIADGIRVISNRNVPTTDEVYMEFGEYGTYLVGESGTLTTLGSPVWLWGRFYENVIRSIMSGAWDQDIIPQQPVSYWWGMNSGVIDVKLHERLPAGVLALADILRKGLQDGTIDPFRRKIIAQDGTIMNDGSRSFTPRNCCGWTGCAKMWRGRSPNLKRCCPLLSPWCGNWVCTVKIYP
jgi:basic membrane lipoprotein Med (substrate-binding protein (PBP1-ABC) superfamily)